MNRLQKSLFAKFSAIFGLIIGAWLFTGFMGNYGLRNANATYQILTNRDVPFFLSVIRLTTAIGKCNSLLLEHVISLDEETMRRVDAEILKTLDDVNSNLVDLEKSNDEVISSGSDLSGLKTSWNQFTSIANQELLPVSRKATEADNKKALDIVQTKINPIMIQLNESLRTLMDARDKLAKNEIAISSASLSRIQWTNIAILLISIVVCLVVLFLKFEKR